MSFILDALKKSESDRQRQSGPALYEVKVVPPKSRFPLWAVALSVLLGVNLVIGGWLLLRRPNHADDAQAQQQVRADALAPPTVRGDASPAPAPQSEQPNTNSGAPNSGATGLASTPAHAMKATPGAATGPALANPPPQGVSEAAAPRLASQSATTTTPSTTAPGGSENPPAAGSANPDDYAPATEPGQPTGLGSHVKRATASGYVLYQDAELIPGANLPQLRLDLHVYAMKPQDRFCLINMRRLREGESTPEGVHVDSITPDGVVMSHNGLTFLLPRE